MTDRARRQPQPSRRGGSDPRSDRYGGMSCTGTLTNVWDERENSESRLPEDESVHLAGLVLTEVFTPSTVGSLHAALERLPASGWKLAGDWRGRLERSRTTGETGWQSLGVVRRSGEGIFFDGEGRTAQLPQGISAVWLSLHYEMPSVAVLTATFCLDEGAGDLSALLRRDYTTRYSEVRLSVKGPLGAMRARVPWARPASYRISYSKSGPSEEKRLACLDEIEGHEAKCDHWFRLCFPGRFASADLRQRPRLRLFLTGHTPPLSSDSLALKSVDLDKPYTAWRSADPLSGWALTDRNRRRGDDNRRFVLQVAARRCDVAREQDGKPLDSNWYLVQRFATYQSSLASKYSLWALLHLYGERLAVLRDQAGRRRARRRPVEHGKVARVHHPQEAP